MSVHNARIAEFNERRSFIGGFIGGSFIGGSEARIIMGQDKALIHLWQEKRGEVGPDDLSTNLIVQLGLVTEDLNRAWYKHNTWERRQGRPVPGQAPRHPVDGGHPRRRHGGQVADFTLSCASETELRRHRHSHR